MEKVKCPYCGKEYSKKGIGTHIWRVHGKGKEHNPNKGFENGTRVTWNKGLTKETDDRVKSYGETIRKTIETNGNSFEGITEMLPEQFLRADYLANEVVFGGVLCIS